MKKSDHTKGVVALIFLGLVFASMGIFARYLSTGFLLFQQVYLRMLAAFVIGLFFFRNQIDFSKLNNIPPKEWLLITVRAVSSTLLGIVLFTQAILTTKYSNVSFISALPMAAVFGFLLFREKFTIRKLGLIILAFIGVLLISVSDYAHMFSWGKGEVLALISTVFFSFSYVARKWHSKLLSNKELTVLNFFVSFLIVFIVSIFHGDGLPLDGWTWGLALAVIVAGIFNILNMNLINYGFQHVEAVLASNILTLESVFAVALGIVFYREIPSIKELLGGAIIVLSVIGMNKAEAKE